MVTPASDTAPVMVEMLRRHYLPEGKPAGGIFAPEIGSPDGRRRADLIWMPTTVTGGMSRRHTELVGHEIKTSRADLQVELADPTKADPWLRYCTRWWLVLSDPALFDLTDDRFPAAWGVMAPPSGRRTRTMTVLRQAPLLHPQEQAPGVARVAAWVSSRASAAEQRLALAKDQSRALQQRADHLERELTAARVAAGHDDYQAGRVIASILSRLRTSNELRASTYLIGPAQVDEDLIVQAVIDAAEVRAAARQMRYRLQHLVRDVEQAAEPFRGAHGALSRLIKETAELESVGLPDQAH